MTMAVRRIRTAGEEALAAQFAALRARASEPARLADLRAEAFANVEASGLPNRRVEDWKYTDLRGAMEEVFPVAPAPAADVIEKARALVDGAALPGARRLVFVDGHFVSSLSDLTSLEAGLSVATFSAAQDGEAFAALLGAHRAGADIARSLNSAFVQGALSLNVAAGASPSRLLHVIFAGVADRAFAYGRMTIGLAEGARLSVAVSVVGAAGARQNNRAFEISLARGAVLDIARMQDETVHALDLCTTLAEIAADARLNTFDLTTGAAVSRNEIAAHFSGAAAHADLHGAALLAGNQHGDTTLFVDHAVADCTSAEQFRAVLDGRARGVFAGRIVVRPDAQKSDARMMSRALLLSEDAEADNKPELEIYADDVTCSHGAVAGRLDEDLLFYLRARGIPEREARALLIQAFVGDATERIASEPLREFIQAAMLKRLEALR